jgi:hypothetical protein
MPTKKYHVTLVADERAALQHLLSCGRRAARTLLRARILSKADEAPGGPAWDDARIADALGCGLRTVERVRERFVEQGLDAALHHKRQDLPSRARLFDGTAEAHLIALACSSPPAGRRAWTVRLLADRLVELEVLPAVSRETVRRVMKKTS